VHCTWGALRKEHTHIKVRNVGVFILATLAGRVEKEVWGQQDSGLYISQTQIL
jgi:hypothetical protein